MDETAASSSSCLAIAEKKPHRPGGCVGIFFQLFDWNRRFAKKKLFSRKLLPPARAKQVSKKFAGDEKMPKTKPHLIADENSGGFPSLKKNGNRNGDIIAQKLEMRPPGLVARLMGLETMPAVHRDKHKKASNSVSCDDKGEKFVNDRGEPNREVVNLEKGSVKVEPRPQKLQKIGQFDSRAVTRFGAEGLQIKNVLSRSRKHHHPRLASPVKSPRISSSSRNASRASRLIDAAARILEPGLQATSRAKSALTYSSSMNSGCKDEVLAGRCESIPADFGRQQSNCASYNADNGMHLMGQTSCKNCGNLLNVVDSRCNVEEQSYVYPSSDPNLVYPSSQGSERINPRPPIFSPEQGDGACERNLDELLFAAKEQHKNPIYGEPITDMKPPAQWGPLRNQQCRPQKDESTSSFVKPSSQTRNEFSIGRDGTPPLAKSNNLQSRRVASAANAINRTKDFVALNRSLSGRARPRMSTKVYNSIDSEKKFCSQTDDSLSHLRNPVHKRRSQTGSGGFANSLSMKQRNGKADVVSGNELGLNAHSLDRSCKERSTSLGVGNRANGNKNNGVVSFTFNSPLRHEISNFAGPIEQREPMNKNFSHQKRLLVDERDSKIALQKRFPLRGDALGELLEQKLKELTLQEAGGLMIGCNQPKKSTAMILQELILALSSEQPISQDGQTFHACTPLQTDAKIQGNDADHLSPGSVLEACLSNDSCCSSSMDDSTGNRLHLDCADYSYYLQRQLDTKADLRDSACSVNGRRIGSIVVTDLLNHISRILRSINLAGGLLTGCSFNYAKEIILIAELLFGSRSSYSSDKIRSSFVCSFLLDDLENLTCATWPNFKSLSGFEENKESNQRRAFSFDCVIEVLDAKYGRYPNSGFKAWRRVPSSMNADMLIHEIEGEVRRWTSMVGMIPDEIIEWEMSHSLGEWTDFEIEAFEAGADIGWDILQILVDEIVIELEECKLGCF